jgi:hypothetical protein
MTIDKIKFYMGDYLFNFWTSQTDVQQIEKARNLLKSEIDAGILKGIEFHAELKLLNHLSAKN